MTNDQSNNPEPTVPIPEQHDRGPVAVADNGTGAFPIVGIGASAGGLEAYQQVLASLPADTGMAFVLIQHLDPHHESRLVDLLARSTPMPVNEATQGQIVEPNHVYIIPPNVNLAINAGKILITPRAESRGVHLPIDYFFRSLAQDQKTRAVGVVLSGTGSDGAQGICEIKAMGGITFAQDESSAKYSGMPHSAAESGCADLILTPDEIGRRLAVIRTHPYLIAPQAAPITDGDGEVLYRKILTRVRAVTGVDFTLYRDTTIKRRIARRMALHTQDSFDNYIQRLEQDSKEVTALYQDLLINVTSFFRDPALFAALKEAVYPALFENKPPLETVRVWVPGCSTGQEAYSIAISLIEFFDSKQIRPPIQIFATDISDPAILDKARLGIYPDNIEAEVSAERLQRFFQKEDHVYRVNKSIRDLCIFARQNLTLDPPFSRVDMVSCRNVLIYLAPPLQKRVLPTLHYALNVPGYLVLGSSESIGDYVDLFEITDRTNKIYAKKPVANRPLASFSAEEFRRAGGLTENRNLTLGSTPVDFQREADRLLIGRYAPPGVLVNENLDIIQFRGRTSQYLESPSGEPTNNLLKMAREGLFLELRNAVEEARREHHSVRRQGVRVRTDGESRSVNLEIVPVRPPAGRETCFLIMFDDAPAPPDKAPSSDQVADLPAAPEQEREATQLRRELTAIKEYSQSLLEQQDAANEELRSANEEILSSNEELQSTNEELETAKEELQSTNEELTTVNEQLNTRNLELTRLNNDLDNVLSSIAIPMVMVGVDLRIRRYTEAARQAINLRVNDIGRPLADLKMNFEIADLDEVICEVIDTMQLREREVRDHQGRWHRLRIHPYRTAENKIEGAVILLIDIDEMKKSADTIRESEARFRLLANTAPVLIWVNGPSGFDFVNKPYLEFVGAASEAELHGDIWSRHMHPQDHDVYVKTYAQAVRQRAPFEAYFRLRRHDGQYRWMKSIGVPRISERGEFLGYVGSSLDITDLKNSEQALRDKDERLQLALEAAALGTWYCDLKTDRLHWDDRIQTLLGLPTTLENEGEGFFSAIHPDDRDKLRAAQRHAMDTGRFTEELRFLRKGGGVTWLLTTAKVFFDSAGTPAYLSGLCFDITEQKQTAAELENRIAELKEGDRQKNEFVALLAHELRNPLAPISNAVEILRNGGVTDEAKLQTTLDIINREVRQMARMLEDLLDVSRLTRNRLDLRKRPLVLGKVIADAIEASRPAIEGKRHTLEVDVPEEDLWLEADRDRLEQVFSNLLLNAAKFTPAGGRIRLGAERQNGRVLVSVSDTGIGIEKNLLPRIFEMFSQGERSMDSGGLGIGLTLVKSLVELHGGTIEAHSEGLHRGSVFSVRLPLTPAPATLPEPDGSNATAAAVQERKKFLVVDDNEMQSTSLRMLLEYGGHDVKVAHDGPGALAVLTEFVPDIALIDVGLPHGMSGHDLAREIRADKRFDSTILVAQTGWGRDEDRERSRAAGFDYHIVKPIDHRLLQRIIDGTEPAFQSPQASGGSPD